MAQRKPAPDRPFVLNEVTLRHRGVEQQAMVMTPRSTMEIGRERVEELSRSTGVSPVERWLVEEARRRGERARIVLFRAANDASERLWQFDPSMSDQELERAGYFLTRALLPMHRRFLAAGVVLMVHTEWGLRDHIATRHGIGKLLDEYRALTSPTVVDEADRWVLEHMLLHVGLSMDHVTGTLLPPQLKMIQRRWSNVRALVDRLPPEAVD